MAKWVPKTIRGFLEEALDPEETDWKIKHSWVSGSPDQAPNTKLVIDFLQSVGIDPWEISVRSIFGNDSFSINVPFLDGGFRADTHHYQSLWSLLSSGAISRDYLSDYYEQMSEAWSEEGAWLSGPRAVLFVALGLGLRVPRQFYENHGLKGVTYDELARQFRLDAAYLGTTYAAQDGEKKYELRVGRAVPYGFDSLLEDKTSLHWAYITAWNPRSVQKSQEENEAAQDRLRAELQASGLSFLEGMSEPDDGSPGEASLLVFVDRERAEALGRAYNQNAIVVGSGRSRPELVWLVPLEDR